MNDLYAILIVDAGVLENALQGEGAIVVYTDIRKAREHCRVYRKELGRLKPVKIATIADEEESR